MGAALEMLRKKKPAPPDDAKEGAAYSKVGGSVHDDGDDDYASDGGSNDDSGEGLPMSDDDHEDAASFESLADHLGIPDEKRDGARAALKTYVKACMRERTSDE